MLLSHQLVILACFPRQKIPLTTHYFSISSYIKDKYPLLRILTIKIEGFVGTKSHNRKNYSMLKIMRKVELAFLQTS